MNFQKRTEVNAEALGFLSSITFTSTENEIGRQIQILLIEAIAFISYFIFWENPDYYFSQLLIKWQSRLGSLDLELQPV